MTIHYTGGYFLLNDTLVRGEGANGHTARDMSQMSDYTVRSVNLIQDTPWSVNGFILDVVSKFFIIGEDLKESKRGKVVLRIENPLDPALDPSKTVMHQVPDEEWQAKTKEERKKWAKERQKHHKTYEEELGIQRATTRIFEMAKEMGQFKRFWFPHNMDFRTRIYPIPNDLTPQSNDFSKGLLQFSRPKRLGKEGLYWLGFMVASHAGEDKLHPDDRAKWTQDNLKEIETYVDDPLSNRGWLDLDKPFQFLAAAHAYVWAIRSGSPENYLSHIPVNLDGSCNGAQHLSIMGRDRVGAKATNCTNDPARHDLYMEVAERVWAELQADLSDPEKAALAAAWKPLMEDPSDRRKVVKRSVMTVPYGVTKYGIADFMLKEHVTPDMEQQWESAKYMRDLVWQSIGKTLKNGQKIQEWFAKCAEVCAENGKALVWDTPAGSKVTQAYMNLIQKRVTAFGMKFYVYAEPTDEEIEEEFLGRIGMDIGKMASAAPPNVVHSCDASHLQITVCRMADYGIRDFSMIHDSFGTHAADVGIMRDIIRQTAVDMYSGDFLREFKESVEKYSGLTMPEPDFELGDFDVTEILESVYFFS